MVAVLKSPFASHKQDSVPPILVSVLFFQGTKCVSHATPSDQGTFVLENTPEPATWSIA